MRLFLLAFILGFAGCSAPQVSSGTEIGNSTIIASAVDIHGKPVVNATVKMLTCEPIPTVLDSLKTDSNGMYSFTTTEKSVSILILTDSSGYFEQNITLTGETIYDTVTAELFGSVALSLEDTAGLNGKLYLAGTGISRPLADAIQSEGRWILSFEKLPAMKNGGIISKSADSSKEVTGSFTITSGKTVAVIAEVRWNQFDRPALPLITLCGTDSALFWGGSSEILKIQTGQNNESYLSDDIFPFANLTSMSFNERRELWVGNGSGGFGYLLKSGTGALVPDSPLKSSIAGISAPGNGSYWIALYEGGITKVTDSRSDTIWRSTIFSEIIGDFSNGIWAYSSDNVVYHIDSAMTVTQFTSVDGINGSQIRDICSDGDGGIAVLTESGVTKIHGDNSVEPQAITGITFSDMQSIAVSRNGMWIAGLDELFLIQGTVAGSISWDGVPFRGLSIEKVSADPNGSLWLLTEHFVYELY